MQTYNTALVQHLSHKPTLSARFALNVYPPTKSFRTYQNQVEALISEHLPSLVGETSTTPG